jgi:tetratricopeptide (TPR) repeat protein
VNRPLTCFILLLVANSAFRAEEMSPDQTDWNRLSSEAPRQSPAQSVRDLAAFLYAHPRSSHAPEARDALWRAASRHQAQERDRALSDEERRRWVETARRRLNADRQRADTLLTDLRNVNRAIQADPQGLIKSLPSSRLLGDGKELTELVELEDLQARHELERIERSLQAQVDSGSLSPISLRVAAGFLALTRNDVARVVTEWTEALRLDPTNDYLKQTLPKLREKQAERDKVARAKALYQEGRRAYEEGRHRIALAKLDSALALQPELRDAIRLKELASLQLDQEKKKQAVRTRLAVAKKNLEEGAVMESVQGLLDVFQLDPANPDAHRALTSVLMTLSAGRVETKSRDRNFNRPAAEEAYSLGMLHYAKDELAPALTYFRKALDLDPSYEEARQAAQSTQRELRAR